MKTYLFDVRDDAEMDGVVITVTLRSYWKKHRHMSDEFYEDLNDLMSENGFDELMENTYESPFSIEETRTKLLKLGLRQDAGFSKFAAGELGAIVPEEDALAPITTELCKEAVVTWISNHPSHVASQLGLDILDEEPARKVSSWKRVAKHKATAEDKLNHPGVKTIRSYNCVPYDDQLRAYVYDNGTWIIHIEVTGE